MISTHILDTAKGIPAGGVVVKLSKKQGEEWQELEKGVTTADGRVSFGVDAACGTYQLLFEVEPYLKKETELFFYSEIPVVFHITDTKRKYHVPLLLNPFGYSTYRGS